MYHICNYKFMEKYKVRQPKIDLYIITTDFAVCSQ